MLCILYPTPLVQSRRDRPDTKHEQENLYKILAQIYSNEKFLGRQKSIMEKFAIGHRDFDISVMNF